MPPDVPRDDGDGSQHALGLQHRANKPSLMGLLQKASRLFQMPKRSTNVALFNNARHFELNGSPQFLTAYNLNVANTYGGNYDLLDVMKPSVSFGALHDSYADDPEHRCRPETRQYVLKRLQDWIDDITATERIFWLHGSAGSGKSAIAHTIVDSNGQDKMAATFFFCRSDTDRNNGNHLFMTLAWQLALSIPSIQSHIIQSLNRNPGLPWKSVETQFKELIAQPFQAIMRNAASKAQLPSLVVIIDGIDECPDESLQRRILTVIGDAASNPDVPLRFLISSRLEAHIKGAFDQFKCPVLCIDLRYEKLEELVSFDAIHCSRGQSLARGWISSSREHTLQQLQGWVDNWSSEPISWLHGPAGSEKSAIAQSIADLNEREKVAATFFLHRSKATCNDGTRLFPTLCWQLASSIPTYKDYIIQYLAQCSFLPRQDVEEQFEKLIVRPFRAVAAVRSQEQPRDWVIIIDGVDECADLKIQQKCLQAIENNVRYRRIPLRFLVTSSIDLGISPLGTGTSAKPYHNLRIAPTKDCEGYRYRSPYFGLLSEPAIALTLPTYDPGSAPRRMLQRLPSRPTSFRGARDAVVAPPALNPQDKSEKGDATSYTNYRAPLGVSSPALHLSSQALPSPRFRPAIMIPVLSEISTPLKLGPQRGKAGILDVASRNTPSRHRFTRPDPVVPTSTPYLPSKSTVSGRLRDKVPVGHLERDLSSSPPATPTPVSRSQPIWSSSRAAASSSNISLVGPPSPKPQTPTRGLSPVRARSPTIRTRLVSPSRLSPTRGCSSPTLRKPFLESSRTSLDPPSRTSYDGISTRTASSASSRGDSPAPAPRRAVSPKHQSYAQNRHFKLSGTSENRELIRNATSMLCREMARPPPHLIKTDNGMRDWEEVERRINHLRRLESVWTKSGAIGLENQSGTILNAAGEDRERNLFAYALKDGYVLCHLINKLRSSSVVRPDAREDGLFRSSNVTKFLAACASYGLPSEDLFQPDDLNRVTGKTLARVAKTVIALINYVETPLPSNFLSGHGKKQTAVPVPVPYRGSMSRASASTPNLLPVSSSPPSSLTRKLWSPPSTLPPVKSNSSEEGSPENSPRMLVKNDIGDRQLVYAKLDTPVMPLPRSTLRPRPTGRTEISGASASTADQSHVDESQNMRQSIVSTKTTVTTVVSSILDNSRSWSGQNKYGTVRTGTTDLTSEAPSLSRTEGSNIIEDMARWRSADGGSKSRDRKPSETPSVARVTEEADENPAWKRDQNKIQNSGAEPPSGKPQKPEKQEKIFLVHRHKGRWPDDFMDLFDQAKPSPIDVQTPPLELDEEFLYSVSPQQASPHAEVSRIEKVEVTEPDRMRRSQSTRYAVDNAVLMPSRLRRKMSPDGAAPAKVMLRRHSTNPSQRNAIYHDPHASVLVPRAALRERVGGGPTPVAETFSNHEQHKVLRGRFQSDVEESLTARWIRPNIDEHFGRRSRIEGMITLGVSTNASASDLKRESIDGSRVKKTIVVKEAGKPPVQYKLGNCIGRGQFGSVYRALNLSTGQTVAVKQIRLEGLKESEVTELMREVNIYKRLSHPGIVKYEGMTRDDETLSIVLECAENGSLGQTLKSYGKLNERLVASYTAKILEGLHYLHGQDVVHGDLKAANILVTKTGNVKLTDFGVSLNLRAMEGEIKNVAGTPNWMAPEIIELKGASAKSDIWSLACTVIELLTGSPPYGEISNTLTVMFRIVEDRMPPIPEECSDLAREFLLQCFNKDPAQRPSAEILFEHPWLKQNWGIYKELRPQDSIPFLRRVSADLQKSDAVRSLPSVPKGIPNARSPLEQRFSASSVLENDFSPREHIFVKTTFSKAMHCRVCSMDVKRGAVICSLCSLVSHSKCAPNAPPTCDLRAQLLPGEHTFVKTTFSKDLGNEHAKKLDVPGVTPPPRSTLRPRSIRRFKFSEFSNALARAADQTHADEYQNMRQSVVSTAMTEGSAENLVKNDIGNIGNEQFVYAKLDVPVMPPFRLDFEDGKHGDIKKYLRAEFSRIATMQGLATTWPGQHVIEDLAHRSSGRFIYANTIVRVIDEGLSNAETLLNLILDLQPPTETPFAYLDELYFWILKWQPDQVFLKDILALVVVRTSILKGYEDLWKDDAVLMNVSDQEPQTKLRRMRSLLHLVPYIKVHHQSFLDFLQDASRSSQYHISKGEGLKRYLKLIIGSLVQYVNNVLNQPKYHETHHFTPQFSQVVKEYPRRIDLLVAEWQEVLQPLLKLGRKIFISSSKSTAVRIIRDLLLHFAFFRGISSIKSTEPTANEFEEYVDDATVIDDSLHSCLSPLLAHLRSPISQSGPTETEIMAQMYTVLYFDCAKIAARIHSVSDAQNLVDVIVDMLDEKYFLDQGDPDVKRKAILLALEIYARIPVLPRSLFLEGSTRFDIDNWNCRNSEIEILCQSALISKIFDSKYIVPVSRVCEEEGKLTFVGCNEYEGRKSLKQWRTRTYPSLGTVTQVMLEVAKAFRYLHSMGVILHYDTDSDDIFLDSELSPTIRFMGSFLLYIVKTPSICLERNSKLLMTREANVFNFGCLFYQTVFNVKIPLKDRVEFKRDTIVKRSKHPTEPDIPDHVWKLIQLCCRDDPKRRPTMNEVVEEMETWSLPPLWALLCPQGAPLENNRKNRTLHPFSSGR